MEVLVAGGGPAGLLLARSLRWSTVAVAEASRRPGVPPHCTGVVSPRVARLLDPGSEHVEAMYEAAVFLDGELREVCRLEARPLAVKLRRPGVEEALLQQVLDAGHRVLLGSRVEAARRRRSRWEAILSTGERLKADTLAVATGFSASGRLPRPWLRRCRRVYGLEARLRLQRRLPGDEFYTIHGTPLAPGFYAWIAPVDSGREAVIGLAAPSAQGLHERLQALRRLVERRLAPTASLRERRGGPIALGPPGPTPLGGDTAWIGDTLCASKPYTGGGLYAAATLAPILAAAIERRGGLEAWKRLRRELTLQYAAAGIARKTPRLMLRLLSKTCREAMRGRCSIDFDRHTSVLRCLLQSLVPVRV